MGGWVLRCDGRQLLGWMGMKNGRCRAYTCHFLFQNLSAYSCDQSLQPVAQFSFLTSVMMISTAPGLHLSVLTVASVMAFASSRFCSTVRPSKSGILMVGLVVPMSGVQENSIEESECDYI